MEKRKRVTIVEEGDEVQVMIDKNLRRNARPAMQIKLAKNCDLLKNIE